MTTDRKNDAVMATRPTRMILHPMFLSKAGLCWVSINEGLTPRPLDRSDVEMKRGSLWLFGRMLSTIGRQPGPLRRTNPLRMSEVL